MRRWAAILLGLCVVLGVLGYGGVGGAFDDLARMLLWIALAAFAVVAVLGFSERRPPSRR